MTHLTARKIQALKPAERTKFYGDSHGLRLMVKPSGAKCWTQRLVIQGKRRDLGLGGWPLVTLDEARDKALENRRIARRGGDPTKVLATFREVAAAKLAFDAPSLKASVAAKLAAQLETHAMPVLGELRAADVRTHHVMDVLEPIWNSKPATASKVLNALSHIFDYALAKGYRQGQDNPAKSSVLKAALPKQVAKNGNGSKHEHREALPYAEVAAALAKVDASKAMHVSKALVRFTALTAVRITEARLAEWIEIDLEAKVWTIPGERMKTKREHRVPLSGPACEILAKQLTLRPKRCEYVFAQYTGKLLGDRTVRSLFRSLSIGTVHGLRSSFRDWGAEQTDTPNELLEMCLAHAVGSQTERAYARTDLLAKRRAVMEAWAEYLAR